MCTRYVIPEQAEIERFWQIGARNQPNWAKDVFPRSQGPFIRRAKDDAGYSRELVVG
jgi:hypothetical protein